MAKGKNTPPENAIEPVSVPQAPSPGQHGAPEIAADKRRRSAMNAAAAPAPAQSSKPSDREEAKAVPNAVRSRFTQVGDKWFFANGDPAFVDQGRKLTTKSENTEVIRSLVEIAEARGWREIAVSGTKDFKRQIWHEAALAGLQVKGFTPSEIDEARLVRALASRGPDSREAPPSDARSADAEPGQRAQREAQSAQGRAPAAREKVEAPGKVTYGTLIAHGPENYRLDPNEEMSYFVRLRTRDGREQTLWGKDLERAVNHSATELRKGDEIGIAHRGSREVTVSRRERDADGKLLGEHPVQAQRNAWTVERAEFFRERAKLAELIRNPHVDAEAAVQAHPELAGSFVAVKGAELLAKRRYDDKQDQQRFVDAIRSRIVREVRTGEPLYMTRMRDQAPELRQPTRAARAPDLAPVR